MIYPNEIRITPNLKVTPMRLKGELKGIQEESFNKGEKFVSIICIAVSALISKIFRLFNYYEVE